LCAQIKTACKINTTVTTSKHTVQIKNLKKKNAKQEMMWLVMLCKKSPKACTIFKCTQQKVFDDLN